MRLSSLLLIVTGFGVAGGSVYLVRDIVANQVSNAQVVVAENPTIGVLVAGSEIAFGQVIDESMIQIIQWPHNALPAGTFNDINDVLPADGGAPRRAKRQIEQGELILNTRVSNWGEKVSIVNSLSGNHRAMAIRVNAETAVGGFVTPGDSVDVLLTQGNGLTLQTVTILQNIRVIGVDQDSDEGSGSTVVARTVTVEVSPNEGQRLALAQQAGTLSLTLRNTIVAEDELLEAVRLSDLMQDATAAPEIASAPTIIVRRGTTLSDEDS